MSDKGTKHDAEKLRMELLDFDALEGLSEVLTYGANKYGANNWRKGISNDRLVGALLRHLSAFLRGEEIDRESGKPHIDHVGANWMFLSNRSKVNRSPTLEEMLEQFEDFEVSIPPWEDSLDSVVRNWVKSEDC